MPAHYEATVLDFLRHEEDLILGRLTSQAAQAGFYQQKHSQTEAWQIQIDCLKNALRSGNDIAVFASDWHILLEYPIPRRGKRLDVVLLAKGTIFVVEFKCGSSDYSSDAVAQVEDYALDLRDFHLHSHNRSIVPILVATHANNSQEPQHDTTDPVKATWRSNASELGAIFQKAAIRYANMAGSRLDPHQWNHSDYSPTPTIIESAQVLYAGQDVKEISRCHGGIENLTKTSDAVIKAIDTARQQSQKVICFITGVPGAGKTLAGLNIVHNHDLHEGELGVFLSGNGPLVKVLREALARDHSRRADERIGNARRRVETFIQNVHKFIDTYFETDKIPVDNVVIFDEAQRAWDAQQSKRKWNRPFAEPRVMLEVMDRHQGWAVIVALIGGGQEINSGEAGLAEWGRAITEHFTHWRVLVSPDLGSNTHYEGGALFESAPIGVSIQENPDLHLDISLRSYKAEALSAFVSALLIHQPEQCQNFLTEMQDYPIVMTRSLEDARTWLRQRQRGSRRTGLLASSGARRLKAYGLDVTAELEIDKWLLNSPEDVRSSYFLETPSTEFGIQGLELDWTGVCWGGDLYPKKDQWVHRKFRGDKWVAVRDARTQSYIVNKYRVLLTRAREGMVVWVPNGSDTDLTRPTKVYDSIATYLASCGIPYL